MKSRQVLHVSQGHGPIGWMCPACAIEVIARVASKWQKSEMPVPIAQLGRSIAMPGEGDGCNWHAFNMLATGITTIQYP